MNISDYIAQADQKTLDTLLYKIRARQTQLRAELAAENARQLEVGSQGRLTDIKPKYLNGVWVTIQGFPAPGQVKVQLHGVLYRKRSSVITVPLACIIPTITQKDS